MIKLEIVEQLEHDGVCVQKCNFESVKCVYIVIESQPCVLIAENVDNKDLIPVLNHIQTDPERFRSFR